MTTCNHANISKVQVPSALLALALALLCPSLASASCLALGGGESLQNYCLLNAINGKKIDYRTITTIDTRLRRTGSSLGVNIPNSKPLDKFTASYSVRPVLRYETNINGGNSAAPLVLGNAVFKAAPELNRVSGTVAGLAASFNGRTVSGDEKYITYSLNMGYALSTLTNDKITSSHANICSFNHLGKSWYLNGCADKYYSRKTITDSSASTVKLMASHIFTGASKKHHEFKFGVKRLFTPSYMQDQLVLGIDTLHPGGVFTGLEATIGKPVPETLVTHIAVAGRVSFKIAGKPLNLSASMATATGGLMLGFVRDEKRASISASYPVGRNLTATIGYSKTDNTIDYFDSATPTIAIQFSAIPLWGK